MKPDGAVRQGHLIDCAIAVAVKAAAAVERHVQAVGGLVRLGDFLARMTLDAISPFTTVQVCRSPSLLDFCDFASVQPFPGLHTSEISEVPISSASAYLHGSEAPSGGK